MCSCLLCAISGGAISPPEEAAEQMHAGTADAGLEKNTGNADMVQDGWVDVSTICRYVMVMTTILYVSGSI